MKKHIRSTIEGVTTKLRSRAAHIFTGTAASEVTVACDGLAGLFGLHDIAIDEDVLKQVLVYLKENPARKAYRGSRYENGIIALESALGMHPKPYIKRVEVRADDLQAILKAAEAFVVTPGYAGLLARIKESLDADVLEPDYPMEEVDAELRAQGGDPESIKARAEKIQEYADSTVARMQVQAAQENRRVHAEIQRQGDPFFCDNCKAGPRTKNDVIIYAKASKVPEAQTTLDRVRNKMLKENRERRNPVGGKNLKPTTPRPDVQPVATNRGPK